MRALLLSLLLANALFLAWATWIDSPAPTAANAGAALPVVQVLSAAGATPSEASSTTLQPAAGDPTPAPDAVTTRCSTFGPLPDADTSRAVQVALEARKLSGRERTGVADELEGFWVHIDRLGDEAARTRAIHRLQVAGIHGAVALADTSQVSVGLFSDQDAASQRAAAVAKAGYKAEFGPRNHAVTRYWLDVEAPTAVPLPSVDALLGAAKEGAAPTWQPCAGVPATPAASAPASASAPAPAPAPAR